MLTRRQKRSLRGFTAVLSCSALLAAFLIFTNISNASDAEPVVFSDILEGAVAYNDGNETPAETLGENEMTETMFADALATFTLRLSPDYVVTPEESTLRSSPEDTPIDIDGLNAATATRTDDTTAAATIRGDDHGALLSNEVAERSPDDLDVTLNEPYATYVSPVTTTAPLTAGTSRTTTYITSASQTVSFGTSETTTTTSGTKATTERTTAVTTAASHTTTTKASTTAPAATTVTTTAPVTSMPSADTTHTEKPPFTNIGGGEFSEDSEIYLTMFSLVNAARREAGLKELWYSARVHEVCQIRTQELTSYYSHNRPDGTRFSTAFKEVGINYSLCGENIAYGRNMFNTPEEVFRAWMDSPSHRENILNPDYECVAFGLSILKVGNDTYYYWSQEFAAFK